jgi:phosphatidylglycerophosphatase A
MRKEDILNHLAVMIGTGFGAGFTPKAPGTAGALLGTSMWFCGALLIQSKELFLACLCITIVVFTILGTWATARLIPFWGNDPSRVVVDEMVGVWVALLAAPIGSMFYGFIAFLLFRFFDIYKPLGIRKLDNNVGAFWVMADDILAGLYSLIIVMIIRFYLI